MSVGTQSAIGWPQAVSYLNVYMSTCLSHRQQPSDLRQAALSHTEKLNAKNAVQVMLGAEAGNVDDIIDMILRSYTGVGANKSPEVALELCTKLFSPNGPFNSSRSTRGRGFALMAQFLFDERTQEGSGAMNIDAVYRGAVYANQAASVGFVPPIVLSIASMIERTGFRRQEDCPPGYTVDRFLPLEDMWAAYDKRKVEIGQTDQWREMRVEQNRNLYFCAASGCGIEGTHKSALSRCNGKCPPQGKPSYCSKQCQRSDWPRHKPFCKEGGPIDDVVTAIRDGSTSSPPAAQASGSSTSGTIPRSAEDIRSGRHERRMNVDLPNGESLPMTSSTMSPDFMRDFRREVERLAREGH